MRMHTIITLAATLATVALIQPAGAAEKPSAEALAKREAECKAKPYHAWVPAHAAGDINPRTKEAYKRDSNGQCRVDSRAVKAAVDSGQIKK